MSKAILLLVVVLLILMALPGCQDHQEAAGDKFIDAPYTTIPAVELSTPTTPEPTTPPGRYSTIQLNAVEIETLARVIWLEARGEPFDGQQAVAEVVFNRMLSTDFPDALDGVIYQERQFSTAKSIENAAPTETQYIAISMAMKGPNILPIDVVFFSTKGENDNVWGTIGGHVFCYPYYWEGEAG